jgi:hypothetical protein
MSGFSFPVFAESTAGKKKTSCLCESRNPLQSSSPLAPQEHKDTPQLYLQKKQARTKPVVSQVRAGGEVSGPRRRGGTGKGRGRWMRKEEEASRSRA